MTLVESKPAATPSVQVDRSAETTAAGIPWYAFNQFRHAVRLRWPSIWSIPVVRDPYDLVTAAQVAPASILDVGATCRSREAGLAARWPETAYRSLDIDRSMPQDYHSFAELDQAFDLVMSLEVLEHVRPDTALDLVASCRDATRPGGLVLMSVPNVYTPAVQLEFTHETAYHYADLGAILTWAGLEVVAAARLFTRPGSRLMLHRLASPVHRLLGIDYCQTVNILARRPEAASL